MNGMGFMWIWVIIFIVIILAGVYFFSEGFKQERAPQRSTSSLEILKQRYAKGEITEEEFKKIKKELV
ncbi:MAG: SHOCT domain-containing protein [Candidatus Bathyarchaeota archaeon]|nr:SHOCT domain-containing protein [Candidatus Bathyarchaeota archaeon]